MSGIRNTVREKILEQKTPFCITEIYSILKDITTDKQLILQVLYELQNNQLLTYECIDPANELYAFIVK